MSSDSNRQIFNAVHDTYDNSQAMRLPSERLPSYAHLVPGQIVLDVGCGTGWSTMVAAKMIGSRGKIIGIDISDRQLEVAKYKRNAAALSNVEYHVEDAESLSFADNSFDVVLSSLFVDLADNTKVFREWNRVLKPGGQLVFSSAGEAFFQPLLKMYVEKIIQYRGNLSLIARNDANSASTPAKCRALLTSGGFSNISIYEEQMGFYIADTDEYWQELTSSIMRIVLSNLDLESQKHVKEEHLRDVGSIRTDRGIWIDIPMIFSVANKR